ncbi:MAG: PAS domain S-box protein [Candidatus Thorarchaeota archaeon]
MSIKVLFIDDDEDTLYIAKNYLGNDSRFDISFCSSSQKALRKLKQDNFDLIVSDHEMPDITGLNLLETLRRKGEDIPFIIFTGRSREDLAITALNLGAAYFVKKGGDSESQYAELAHIIQKTYDQVQDSRALQKSEMMYRTLVHSMHDLVLVQDKNDCYVQYHGGNKELLHLPPKEFLNKHLSEVLPGYVSKILLQTADEVRNSKETSICEFNLSIRNQDRWFEAKLSLHEDRESVVTVVRDITKRRRNKEKLQLAQFSLDNAANPIIWIARDASIIYVNRMACFALGYSEDELLQMSIVDIDMKKTQLDWPDLWQDVRELGSLHLETELLTRSSRVFPVEIYLSHQKFGNREFGFAYIIDMSETWFVEKERQEAESAFKDESEKAQLYLDTAGVMFVALDNNGRISLLNRRACEILECHVEQSMGKDWFETFLPPRVKEEVKGVFTRLMKGDVEPVEDVEGPILTSDGNERIIRWRNTILRDEGGEIIGTFSSGEDVTDQRKAEYLLRASESKFRGFFNEAPIGMTIVDTNDHIMEANKKFQEFVGYNIDELRSMKIAEFTAPNDATLNGKLFKEVLDGESDGYKIEKEYIRKDGESVWGDVTVSCIRNASGLLEFVMGMVEDITERKRIEIALGESEKRYRELIAALPEGIGISNFNEELIFCNDAFAELLGYTRDELLGRSVLDFIHSDDIEKLQSESSKRKSGISSIYEIRMQHKSGKDLVMRISAVPLENEHHMIIGSVAVISDVTEQNANIDMIRRQKAELSTLAHILRHDLGNNFHTLLAYLSLLESQHDSDVIQRTKLLVSRMSDLLSSSVILADAGLVIDTAIDVNLEAIVDEIASTVIPEDIKFERDNLPILRGDPQKISQIFQNLLLNAVEHGKPQVIEIRLKRCKDSLTILIQNDGDIINRKLKEDLLRGPIIVEKGKRGFGLAIVKKLVEAHGWEITMEPIEKTSFKIIINNRSS